MDLEKASNAIDFLLILGEYCISRMGEAWTALSGGFNPWNAKAVVGGAAGVLYLLGILIFLAILIYDGFAYRSQRNAICLTALLVLFVLSHLR